jgi:hypothetical protein
VIVDSASVELTPSSCCGGLVGRLMQFSFGILGSRQRTSLQIILVMNFFLDDPILILDLVFWNYFALSITGMSPDYLPDLSLSFIWK